MAHEITQADDVAPGSKRFAQQPGGMELLQPLRILDIALFARHRFDVPRIDQTDLETGILEQRVGGDPIVTGAFQCDGANAATQEPVAQGLDALGEAGEGPHAGLRIASGRHGDEDFLRADVDPGGVRVGLRIEADDILLRLAALFAGLLFSVVHDGFAVCSFKCA